MKIFQKHAGSSPQTYIRSRFVCFETRADDECDLTARRFNLEWRVDVTALAFEATFSYTQ